VSSRHGPEDSSALKDGREPVSSPRRLIYLHVPKTGGTTLRGVIERQYGLEAVFKVDGYDLVASIQRYRNLSENARAEIKAFVGHMPFGWHDILDESAVYVTLLRHPVGRIVSHYRYVLRTPEAALHEDTRSRQLSLEEYVQASPGASIFNNGQTRLLAGPLLRQDEPVTEETLELAKGNIEERFLLVGVTERFDESLLMMRRELRWRLPLYAPAKIAPPFDKGVSSKTRRVIEDANALDIDLYRFAEVRLRIAAERRHAALALELHAFRMSNRAYRLRLARGVR
jgi:Galactose-3-O-sulfotransferase